MNPRGFTLSETGSAKGSGDYFATGEYIRDECI